MFDFFDIIVSMLRVLGMWFDKRTNIILSKCLLLIHILMAVLFVLLEFLFIFTTTDYIERIKSAGAITYHVLCICKALNALRTSKVLHRCLTMLKRENFVFDDFIDNYHDKVQRQRINLCVERFKRDANRFCISLLIIFVTVSHCSIFASYFGALSRTFGRSENASIATQFVPAMPYNHYHILDLSNRRNFVIETLLQAYVIVYLTSNFVCKYS